MHSNERIQKDVYKRQVPVRRHHGDAPAILFQRGHRILHRRVLVPGDDLSLIHI